MGIYTCFHPPRGTLVGIYTFLHPRGTLVGIYTFYTPESTLVGIYTLLYTREAPWWVYISPFDTREAPWWVLTLPNTPEMHPGGY